MTDKIKNFYTSKEVKAHVKKYDNPNYTKLYIAHPFRMLIVGSSGSGKTNIALEILRRMSDTFDRVILCVKTADEPLYQYLQSRLKDLLIIYEGGKVPTPKEVQEMCSPKEQILLIFDDLVNERKQDNIVEWYIRGRKICKGVSMMYLTQSYFKTPKTIRLQCNVIILKKVANMRDVRLLCSDYDIGKSKEQLTKMYEQCIQGGITSFLTIRLDEDSDSPYKFTRNFTETC